MEQTRQFIVCRERREATVMTKNRKAVRSEQVGKPLGAALATGVEGDVVETATAAPITRNTRRKARA